MIALAFSLAYAGWAALCFAMPSHARSLRGRPFTPSMVAALRCIGSIALLAALPASAQAWGWPNGATAWFGVLTMACLVLIGLLSWSARMALLPLALLPIAVVVAVR